MNTHPSLASDGGLGDHSKNAAPESGMRGCMNTFTGYDTRIIEYTVCSRRVASSGSVQVELVEVGDASSPVGAMAS